MGAMNLVITLMCGALLLEGLVMCVSAGPLVEKESEGEISTELRERRQAGACGCDAYLYDHLNYGGRSLLVKQQNAKFHNDFFNDRTESAKIVGTCSYILYEHADFKGKAYILVPGHYASPHTWGGNGNTISSARALPPPGTTAILLFEHYNYEGGMLVLYSSHSDLQNLDYNDKISSAIVIGGSWTVYEHTNYSGKGATIGPGHYPSGIPGMGNDVISSVKRN